MCAGSIVRCNLQSCHIILWAFGEWSTCTWNIFGESYLKILDKLCGILKHRLTGNLFIPGHHWHKVFV